MVRKLFLATLLLSATPWAFTQERDPRLRVAVRLAQGAPADTASAVPDVEDALRRARPDALVGPPSGEAPADVELWLVFRRMWARGSRLPSDPARSTAESSGVGGTASLAITLAARAVAGRESRPVEGSGSSPKAVAQNLVAALEREVREQLPVLLRARRDWRDPGFDFDTLSKERRKELGIKEGAARVTAVRSGPAQEAGVAVGDVVLRAEGRKLEDAADLASVLYRAAPGARVDLALVRGPERRTATLTVR